MAQSYRQVPEYKMMQQKKGQLQGVCQNLGHLKFGHVVEQSRYASCDASWAQYLRLWQQQQHLPFGCVFSATSRLWLHAISHTSYSLAQQSQIQRQS
jgi:hypothetical protein